MTVRKELKWLWVGTLWMGAILMLLLADVSHIALLLRYSYACWIILARDILWYPLFKQQFYTWQGIAVG